MIAEPLTLEGLPTSISRALNEFWSATFDCGADAGGSLDRIQPANAARHLTARQKLVDAIKEDRASLASIGRPSLPAAGTVTLGGREKLEGMLVLDLPPFDGVEDAQMAEARR